MLKGFYTQIRFMGKVVAYIVVLVAIVGGSITYMEIGEESSSTGKSPQVKFSSFEEYVNEKSKSLSKKELRALKNNFQEEFLKNFELISKNISIYATATNQPIPDDAALEEHLFTIVSKYSYEMRTSYLTQLVTETSNLVSYSEVVATDKTKTNIRWTDFLDWFTSDFRYQVNNNSTQTEYITIEASKFEKATIAGMVLIAIMLSIMLSLLLRRDTKVNPIAAKVQESVKTTPKTEVKPAAKAPEKKKPVAKKKPVVKKEDTPKTTPEVKPTGETK